MKGLVAHAHAQPNMKIEWYLNSCFRGGPQFNTTANYEGDVRALQDFGFDGVKFDGCGRMNNMTKYAEIMLRSGLNITVEDCHDSNTDQGQGGLRPTKGYCPWTSFRTSNDIQAFAEAWFWNLQTVLPFLDPVEPLSQPHCWAYPDMLEVGMVQEPVPGS
jgi:hypothetical protein